VRENNLQDLFVQKSKVHLEREETMILR
jgi:hypothetical protein